jgi:hypothetical protein
MGLVRGRLSQAKPCFQNILLCDEKVKFIISIDSFKILGGTVFFSSKLGMHFEKKELDSQTNWGPFDLEYGIALMVFVLIGKMQRDSTAQGDN